MSTCRRLAFLFFRYGIQLRCLRRTPTPDIIKVKRRAASVNPASRVQAIVFRVINCELELLHLPARVLGLYTTPKVRTEDFSSNLINISHHELQLQRAAGATRACTLIQQTGKGPSFVISRYEWVDCAAPIVA